MNQTTCIHCARPIVFAKSQTTGTMFPLEKIKAFEVKFEVVGWTAIPVEPADNEDLYVAHSKVCSKKETS